VIKSIKKLQLSQCTSTKDIALKDVALPEDKIKSNSATWGRNSLRVVLYSLGIALILGIQPVQARKSVSTSAPIESETASAESPPANIGQPVSAAARNLEQTQAKALKKQQDIERYLQDTDTSKAQWLNSADGESFLSLYRADQTGESLGLILLLHGEGQHLAADPILESLRIELPEMGWSTMSIGLLTESTLLRAYSPPRASLSPLLKTPADNIDAAENSDSKSSKKNPDLEREAQIKTSSENPAQLTVPAFPALSTLKENFTQRLTATLPIIAERAPRRLVVAAFDISALWLYETLSDGLSLPGLEAIVIIDAYQPENYENFDLIQASIDNPLALYDISVFHPDAHIQGQLRRIRAQQKQRSDYRYVKLTHPIITASDKKRFTHRISSWLKRILKDVK
jgi:hypothetical protein